MSLAYIGVETRVGNVNIKTKFLEDLEKTRKMQMEKIKQKESKLLKYWHAFKFLKKKSDTQKNEKKNANSPKRKK